MIRVTSGSAKGKKLKTPSTIPGFRAIQDKVKLAVFSALGEKIIDAKCLDLYAGSGSFGIEALSRGAAWCDFVEKTRTGGFAIEDNLKETGLSGKAEIFRQDAVKFVGNTFDKYDVVFLDPFFENTHFRYLLEHLEELIGKKGVVVFSHGKDMDIKDALTNTHNFEIHTEKRYGSAYITILKLVDKQS